MLVLLVTWFCCDRHFSDWDGNGLWYLGRRRKCCPGVWTLVWVEQQIFSFLSVLLSVLLRFLTFCNLNGWLDAPLQGLLGFFLFSAEILFLGLTIYLIPSVQRALGGTVPMLRTPKPPFHNLVPPGLYLSQTHTPTHLHAGSPNTPMDLIFSIYTVYSLTKKLYNLKNIFLIL